MHEILPLKKEQIDLSVRVLTSVFADDVMWEAILPDAEERNRAMPMMWRGVISYCQRYGIVSTTSDIQGVAAWTKPGHSYLTLWKHLRTRFLLARSVTLMSKPSRARFIGVMKQIEALHRQLMPQPHWYLWALGVDPSYQGQGIGGSLLEPVIAQAQEDGISCYLETQTEDNAMFYHKRRFELLHVAEFPETGFKLWLMCKSASIGQLDMRCNEER